MSNAKLLVCVAIIALLSLSALAMPNIIQYQGKLTNSSGAGINDSLEMNFAIFNTPIGGASIWNELHSGANEVFVHKGLFDVPLGSINPINLPFDATYYLEITVAGNILEPRILLTTSPYAYRAAIADSVVGGSGGDTCLWADHSTEPLIFAKNNNDVFIRDNGDNPGDLVINMNHSSFGSSGLYVYRDGFNNGRHVSNIYAYRAGSSGIANGGTSWDYVDVDAAIKGYTLWGNKFTAAIAGYNWLDYDTSAAVIGAYYNGDLFGALGYSCDGNMYSGYFFGEAVHFHPMSRPLSPVLGDIYTDETSLKMYFYNGVDWVDMTATPGAGSSLWTDHATDPYIYANNNNAVQVWDSGEDTTVIIWNDNYLGTAIKAQGGFAMDCIAYLGTGIALPDHPFSWSAAGVAGISDFYVDGVYGYARLGGFGVLGVSGYDEDGYGGVGGYNFESGFWGRLGTYYYGGEFTEGIKIQPKSTPPAANEGAIYANSADKNLYYYDGTAWVDLTAGGVIHTHWGETWTGAGLGLYLDASDMDAQYKPTIKGRTWASSPAAGYVDCAIEGIEVGWGGDSTNRAIGRLGAIVGDLSKNIGVYGWVANNLGWGGYAGYFEDSTTSNFAYFCDGVVAGYFSGDVRVTGKYLDTSGDGGTSGQILSSTGAGTNWIDAPSGTGGVSGSGTVNYLPLWTPTGTALGTSKLRDEGTYTLIHGVGMTPVKPGNFSVAADDATDYFGLWASNYNGRTTAGSIWTHDGVGGGGIYADNNTDSKYYAGVFAFNWSNAETTAAVVGADYYSSNFGALAYRANNKTHAGYFKGLTFVTGSYPDTVSGWVGSGEGILNVINTNTANRSYGIQSRIPFEASAYSGAVVGSIKDPASTDGVMGALGYNNHLSQRTAVWAYDGMHGPSTSYAVWARTENTSGYAGYFDGNFQLAPRSSSIAVFGNIYASTVDNKLYFHNGTTWVDLTAGGGSSLWTDAGTYISANTNTAARVYDEGQTYGLYYSGANKYGVYGYTNNTIAGASGVFGYANTSTAGSGFGPSYSIAGVKGHSLYGNAYHFGVHGDTYSNDAGSPTAGVIGTFTNDAAIWGALAYKHTDASVWAGYFSGDVNITGDLTISGDYLHDHWAETWTGSGSQGLRLSNTAGSTNQIDLATDINGITVTHYNSASDGAAISAMEGDGSSSYTYSYAKLAWYTDGTLPTNPANVAVYGRIPSVGGGGFAVYGENTRTAANQYAGYFKGNIKVDGRVETSQNPYCITLTAGENIAVGEVVMVSTTTDLQVVRATSGSETVIGVAVNAATTGDPVIIAIGGVVQVLCNSAVTRGNFVRCGGAAGQVVNGSTTGAAGDFGIFLQSIVSPAGGLAWMVFKQAEIY